VESKRAQLSIGVFVATLVAILLLRAFLFAPYAETLTYSEFKTLVKKGKVNDLVLDKQVITGKLAAEGLEGLLSREKLDELKRHGGDAQRFTTARLDDPGLIAELEAANVKFTGRVENPWLPALLSWILPAIVFVGVWPS
jgi:cell division protease FtsH